MNALLTSILVAFLDTGTGGAFMQLPYADEAACLAAGEELEGELESVTLARGQFPTLIWTCIPN